MSLGAIANLLLPMIEANAGAAMGSTAAAVGRPVIAAEAAAAKGATPTSGLGNVIHKIMGGVEGYGTQEGLGAGVQQAQLLADSIAKMQLGLESNAKQMQDLIASAKAKPGTPDPFTGAMGPGTPDRSQDPSHLEALAALQRQRAEMERMAKAKAAELSNLHARISQTTNPTNYGSMIGNAAMLGGSAQLAASAFSAGGGSSSFGSQPGIFGSLASMVGFGRTVAAPLAGTQDPATREVISGASSYLSDTLKDLADPLKTLSGANLSKLGELPGLLDSWAKSLLNSTRALGQFDTRIAAASMLTDWRELQRNIETSERIGGAYSGLAREWSGFKDRNAPLKDAGTVLTMRGLERGLHLLNRLIDISQFIADHIPYSKQLDEWLERQKQQNANNAIPPLSQLLRENNARDPRQLP